MATLKPKEFIQKVFIAELSELSQKNHYISFAIMAIGIEFLGKCLDASAKHWNVSKSEKNFIEAIESLNAFKKYRQHKNILYTDLRCGFAHSFVPKSKLTLSSKNEMPHMNIDNGRLNLRCEDFYEDFKSACEEVISKEFNDINNKMNRDLLLIPGDTFNEDTNIPTAVTESNPR